MSIPVEFRPAELDRGSREQCATFGVLGIRNGLLQPEISAAAAFGVGGGVRKRDRPEGFSSSREAKSGLDLPLPCPLLECSARRPAALRRRSASNRARTIGLEFRSIEASCALLGAPHAARLPTPRREFPTPSRPRRCVSRVPEQSRRRSASYLLEKSRGTDYHLRTRPLWAESLAAQARLCLRRRARRLLRRAAPRASLVPLAPARRAGVVGADARVRVRVG
jgi:hypothetical protein